LTSVDKGRILAITTINTVIVIETNNPCEVCKDDDPSLIFSCFFTGREVSGPDSVPSIKRGSIPGGTDAFARFDLAPRIPPPVDRSGILVRVPKPTALVVRHGCGTFADGIWLK
jgi:hypothetical protein